MAQRPASRIPTMTAPQPGAELPFSDFSQRVENMNFPVPQTEPDVSVLPEFVLRRPSSPAPRFDFSEESSPAPAPKLAAPDTHGPLYPGSYLPEPESLEALKDLRPLGQIHDSFIVAAGRDGLWIVDQHVAHERILFEQVLAARNTGKVETQRLLVPLVIGLSAAQQIEYAGIAEELDALGFETEPFGNFVPPRREVGAGGSRRW